MIEHLPVLLIIIPLLAAPLCVLLRTATGMSDLALLASWAAFAIVRRPARHGSGTGRGSTPWAAGRRPGASSTASTSSAPSSCSSSPPMRRVVLPYAPPSVAREIPESAALPVLCRLPALPDRPAGHRHHRRPVQPVRLPRDLRAVLLRPDQPGRDRRALTAAFRYLVMGTIGATFILIGIGLLYMMTGTLNMADMAAAPASPVEQHAHRARRLRLPHRRHQHQDGARSRCTPGCPTPTPTRPPWSPPSSPPPRPRSPSTSCCASSSPSTARVRLREIVRLRRDPAAARAGGDLRRLHRGHLPDQREAPAGLLQPGPDRLHGARHQPRLDHRPDRRHRAHVQPRADEGRAVPRHGLHRAPQSARSELDDLRGLGRRMPLTMAALVVGGLGLIGVPLTAGFISKWYLILGAAGAPGSGRSPRCCCSAPCWPWSTSGAWSRWPTSMTPPESAAPVREAPLQHAHAHLDPHRRHALLRRLHDLDRRGWPASAAAEPAGRRGHERRRRAPGPGSGPAPRRRARSSPLLGPLAQPARDGMTLVTGRPPFSLIVGALIPTGPRRRPAGTRAARGPARPAPGLRGGAAGAALRPGRLRPLDRHHRLLDRLHARATTRSTRPASTSSSPWPSPPPSASPSPETCSRCSCSTRC